MAAEQDLVKRLEEMMAKMMERSMAPVLERLQKIEVSQGKQATKEEDKAEMEDEDFIFSREDKEDYYKKKEAESKKKEAETKKKGKEVQDISAEVEKMKTILRKSQGIEEYMLDMDELCPFPNVQLPPKFKMPKMDVFDGTGNPRNHLKQYILAMKPIGLSEEQIVHCFPRTLNGDAMNWYLSLDIAKTRDWKELAMEFVHHYNYNAQLDVTLRDLETTKQKNNETFSEFLMRWRAKAVKMPNRPTEKDQVRMIVKNLLPAFGRPLMPIPLRTFEDLYDAGIQVEDGMDSGLIDKNDGKKRTYGFGSSSASNGNKANEVNAVNPRGGPREFSSLGVSLSTALRNLVKRGKLRPLDPTPINKSAPNYNENEYCDFHQSNGHHTDRCGRLRHTIQDMIDSGKLPRPEEPNTVMNPLPNHHAMPPPYANGT